MSFGPSQRVANIIWRPLLHRNIRQSLRVKQCFSRPFCAARPSNHHTPDPRIQARPPGEEPLQDKYPLPDKDKELELSKLQVQVNDRYRSGHFRQALDMARDLLQATQAHFGRDHPATAAAENNIGLMHKQLGEFDASRRHYRRAQAIYRSTVGEDHASFAAVLHNLGTLNRDQIHVDADLSATDRLSLLESAIDYLQQAWQIRVNELGVEHAHTVASRSSLGAALAAEVLARYKATPSQYRPVQPVSAQAWMAAEEHLRGALATALAHPRGPSVQKTKKRSKQKTSSTTTAGPVVLETLSSALAAQNLAIFLKIRATTETPHRRDWLEEAHSLYQQVLHVRQQLLPKAHPDIYATKHSLAELLAVMGEQEAAHAVRQDIVDSYDPTTDD